MQKEWHFTVFMLKPMLIFVNLVLRSPCAQTDFMVFSNAFSCCYPAILLAVLKSVSFSKASKEKKEKVPKCPISTFEVTAVESSETGKKVLLALR